MIDVQIPKWKITDPFGRDAIRRLCHELKREKCNADGYRVELEHLRENGVFPCIIYWNFNHFVVLNGFRGHCAWINDPARGEVKVPMEEFDRSFTGICLQITPGEGFEPSGRRKSTLAFAKSRLPEGSKPSPGAKDSTSPVKDSSNCSMGIWTTPRAGSFSTALPFLNPSSTTKWLNSQWMMQGKVPLSFSPSSSMR